MTSRFCATIVWDNGCTSQVESNTLGACMDSTLEMIQSHGGRTLEKPLAIVIVDLEAGMIAWEVAYSREPTRASSPAGVVRSLRAVRQEVRS